MRGQALIGETELMRGLSPRDRGKFRRNIGLLCHLSRPSEDANSFGVYIASRRTAAIRSALAFAKPRYTPSNSAPTRSLS